MPHRRIFSHARDSLLGSMVSRPTCRCVCIGIFIFPTLLATVVCLTIVLNLPSGDVLITTILACFALAIIYLCLFGDRRQVQRDGLDKSSTLSYSWARLTFADAVRLKTSSSSCDKPCVFFERHFISTKAKVVEPVPVGEMELTRPRVGFNRFSASNSDQYRQKICNVNPLHSPLSVAQPELLCVCCLRDFEEVQWIALLRCGHLFCEECITLWATQSQLCPVCRSSMLAPNDSLHE